MMVPTHKQTHDRNLDIGDVLRHEGGDSSIPQQNSDQSIPRIVTKLLNTDQIEHY
jgi:hypothetical protein